MGVMNPGRSRSDVPRSRDPAVYHNAQRPVVPLTAYVMPTRAAQRNRDNPLKASKNDSGSGATMGGNHVPEARGRGKITKFGRITTYIQACRRHQTRWRNRRRY